MDAGLVVVGRRRGWTEEVGTKLGRIPIVVIDMGILIAWLQDGGTGVARGVLRGCKAGSLKDGRGVGDDDALLDADDGIGVGDTSIG